MTTRTGLLASPQKRIRRVKKTIDINSLLPCAITRPAPFAIKPLADIFNPYTSKGCSILCNHPRVIKPPISWASQMKQQNKAKLKNRRSSSNIADDVPEEYFRRYTDTDSRPLTPTPSCATSAKTRTGASLSHLSVRRCVTPDVLSTDESHERKQIILDLRRSHSQETLYYASSDINQDSMSMQSRSIRHEIEIVGAIPKDDIEDIPEMEEEDGEHIPDFELINDMTEDPIDLVGSCINARDDDEDFLSRRGRLRKKKSKSSMSVITFQPSNEIETQVGVLPSNEVEDQDHDHEIVSPNLSARTSLIAESNITCFTPMPPKVNKRDEEFYNVDKSFFLDEDSLKTLRMGLNIEVVECIFDRYRHRTLQEVLRTISPEKLGVDSDAVLEMKQNLNLVETDYEKWLHLPRKYSRYGCRFEIPMDLKELFKLKPLPYLSKFVFIETDKKQLYHRIFVKFLPKEKIAGQENEGEEMFARSNSDPAKRIEIADSPFARCLQGENLDNALKEVLGGFNATDEKIQEIYATLELDGTEEPHNFRAFSGICAFSERFLTTLSQHEDPRNEIEIADFETLARNFDRIESDVMKTVFNIIQK